MQKSILKPVFTIIIIIIVVLIFISFSKTKVVNNQEVLYFDSNITKPDQELILSLFKKNNLPMPQNGLTYSVSLTKLFTWTNNISDIPGKKILSVFLSPSYKDIPLYTYNGGETCTFDFDTGELEKTDDACLRFMQFHKENFSVTDELTPKISESEAYHKALDIIKDSTWNQYFDESGNPITFFVVGLYMAPATQNPITYRLVWRVGLSANPMEVPEVLIDASTGDLFLFHEQDN